MNRPINEAARHSLYTFAAQYAGLLRCCGLFLCGGMPALTLDHTNNAKDRRQFAKRKTLPKCPTVTVANNSTGTPVRTTSRMAIHVPRHSSRRPLRLQLACPCRCSTRRPNKTKQNANALRHHHQAKVGNYLTECHSPRRQKPTRRRHRHQPSYCRQPPSDEQANGQTDDPATSTSELQTTTPSVHNGMLSR